MHCHRNSGLLIVAILSLASEMPRAAAANSESLQAPYKTGVENPPEFPTQFERESDKGPIFQYYARTLTNLSYPDSPRASKDEVEFCQDLGKDLRTLRGMTFVEPIAKGKTIDDPAVHSYWPKCPELKPGFIHFPPEDSPNGMGPPYYWKGSVTLYQVDYQNGMAANQDILLNYAPGSEPLLLFSERLCVPEGTSADARCIGSIYHRVDPDQCTLDGNVVLAGDIYIDQNKYNLNAVIRYKGLVWLIAVADGTGQYQKYLRATADGPIKPVRSCLFNLPIFAK